jgi:NO-binding membrane sensor protein with MHYT domain
MGLGIWSMHYIGMLAFSLPVRVLYDWPTVPCGYLAPLLPTLVYSAFPRVARTAVAAGLNCG